jgi:hypothetical protein
VIEEGRHMIELDPGHFLGHWVLGVGLIELGRRPEAVGMLERACELSGRAPFTLGFLAYGLGCSGRLEDARALLAEAEERAATGYIPPSTFAMCAVGLGEWDTVFTWIDRAIDARDPIIMPIRTFPFLDGIREDVRYRALLEKMRL